MEVENKKKAGRREKSGFVSVILHDWIRSTAARKCKDLWMNTSSFSCFIYTKFHSGHAHIEASLVLKTVCFYKFVFLDQLLQSKQKVLISSGNLNGNFLILFEEELSRECWDVEFIQGCDRKLAFL